MNKKIGLIISLVFLILLCACQSTPDKDAVVNKNDGKLEELISSAPIESEQTVIANESDETIDKSADDSEPGVLTERWTQPYSLEGLECEIDADIILPDKKEFPVYKIKQREFDDETIKRIVKYFTKDATGMRETSPTKEELEMQLVYAKRGKFTEAEGIYTWESYEGQQEDIARLEEQIKNTGEEAFSSVTDDIVLPIAYTYAMPDGSRVHVLAKSNSINITPLKDGIVQPESWVIAGEAYPGEPKGTTLDNVKISQQDAYEMVNAFLKEVGIKNMGIAESEKARLRDAMMSKTVSEGWCLTLCRNDGGSVPLNITSQHSGVLYYRSEDYTQRWYPEAMRIYVDDTGVKTFAWNNPIETVEVLNQNVLVLNFDEVKERILGYIKYGYSYVVQQFKDRGSELSDQKIKVKKIVLTNVMIPIKNETEYQMLVPAWIIYYDQEAGMNTVSAFIAVNAIDGSSIDLKVRTSEE